MVCFRVIWYLLCSNNLYEDLPCFLNRIFILCNQYLSDLIWAILFTRAVKNVQVDFDSNYRYLSKKERPASSKKVSTSGLFFSLCHASSSFCWQAKLTARFGLIKIYFMGFSFCFYFTQRDMFYLTIGLPCSKSILCAELWSSLWKCFIKKGHLKISQNSQENTCATVSFPDKAAVLKPAILLKTDSDTSVFL